MPITSPRPAPLRNTPLARGVCGQAPAHVVAPCISRSHGPRQRPSAVVGRLGPLRCGLGFGRDRGKRGGWPIGEGEESWAAVRVWG